MSPLLWLHNKPHLSDLKTIKVKWFGILLVFIQKIEHYMALGDTKFLFAALIREIFFKTRREISYLHAAHS